MTTSKDKPEALPSGMQNQNNVSGNIGAANRLGSAPTNLASSTATQVPDLSQEDIDPMQRLAQIVAQSQYTSIRDESAPATIPVPPAALPETHVRQTAYQETIQTVVVGERIAPSPYDAQMFATAESAFQSVERVPDIESVSAPPKRGFFSKKKAARNKQNKYDQKNLPRTSREKRVARRRRRLWFEELLGWIFVPIILLGLYWAALGIIALAGTTPEALISGFKLIMSHFW